MLPPLAFQHAPAHPQETSPGQDAKRQPKPPDGQVLEGVQVGAARPLQGPGQVSVGAGLQKLLTDFLDPFRVELKAEETRSAEGIGLENAESQQGEDRTDHQEDKSLGDEIFHRAWVLPVLLQRQKAWTDCGVSI